MMDFYKMTGYAVLGEFDVDDEVGLANDEIRARIRQYGENSLPEEGESSVFVVLLRQFYSPLMVILLFAAFASLLVHEVSDAIVIGVSVLVNGLVGYAQERKAEKAERALKGYEIPKASVMRGGDRVVVDAGGLVPGDIVYLEAGDRIPADLRLIETAGLEVDESLLTGEAYPVLKSVGKIGNESALGDRVNMGYFGTLVASGRGRGVVVATGLKTELGDIAALVAGTAEDMTPLQEQIRRFSWMLGGLFVFISVFVFFVGLFSGKGFFEMIELAIALAVASIPEGLLVSMTVILAIGMQRMLKRRALVRRLLAAETLGSVSVVCADKTGTITQGRMVVVDLVAAEGVEEVSVLRGCVLNNDALLNAEGVVVGHPTEAALMRRAVEGGVDVAGLLGANVRIGEVGFSSERKFMVTVHRGACPWQGGDGVYGNGEFFVVKGAPERVFEMCGFLDGDRGRFEKIAEDMTLRGLRVLAIAGDCDDGLSVDDFSGDDYGAGVGSMRLLGLVGLEDPLRDNAVGTLDGMRAAGIRIVIITGDHPDTARSIALQAGVEVDEGGVVVGEDLDDLSDVDLDSLVGEVSIFARVSPRHKVRIVEAWRRCGETVAMVGDGVNDAAAMKAADIGVALGSGTDVARETSDMVLLDDDLSSVLAAVREGRIVFDNVQKVIVYLMADSFSEIILISMSLLIGLPLPIIAVQILWVNLISDGLPGIALTMESGEDGIMDRVPRRRDEPVINKDMKVLIFLISIVTDIGLFFLYWLFYSFGMDIEYLRTLIFSSIAIDSLFYVFSVRNLHKSVFSVRFFTNKWLVLSVIIGVVMQILVVHTPVLQDMFFTVSLSFVDWSIVLLLAFVKIVVIEVTKMVNISLSKRKILI